MADWWEKASSSASAITLPFTMESTRGPAFHEVWRGEARQSGSQVVVRPATYLGAYIGSCLKRWHRESGRVKDMGHSGASHSGKSCCFHAAGRVFFPMEREVE